VERVQLEVVVQNASEALEAQRAGASRVELAADLECGGLTPAPQIVESVVSAVSIPVHVMLRPHDGGFAYTSADRSGILDDAARLRELGAKAIVFGALDQSRHVAAIFVREVLHAGGLPMTFHRAFDGAVSLSGAYATLAGIDGVERVLTSGGAATAWEGRTWLRDLACGNTRPTVLAAGSIDGDNVLELLRFTGLHEVHIGRGARTDGKIDAHKVERLAHLLAGGAGS
jgi:copper homeostasis protein